MSLINGLVSYWKMDEASGSIIDAHGSNHGTYTGELYSQEGKINTAIGFDGDDYVDVGGASSLDLGTNDYSISAWVKTSDKTEHNAIVQADDNFSFAPLYIQQTTGLMRTAIDEVAFSPSGGSDFADGIWHHLAISFDRNGDASFYLDGILDGTATISAKSGYSISVTNLYMGRSNTLARYWNGTIDEVAIWSRALESGEISSLFNSGDGWPYPFSFGVGVNDSVTATESLSLLLGNLLVSKYDSVALTEAASPVIDNLSISKYDTTALSDHLIVPKITPVIGILKLAISQEKPSVTFTANSPLVKF